MIRIEIIANKSIEEDIVEILENNIKDFYYTLIPTVHGRGKNDRKMGTFTWPEENFLLISYVETEQANEIVRLIKKIKEKFPNDGLKTFLINII